MELARSRRSTRSRLIRGLHRMPTVARDGAGFVRLEGRSIIVDWRMEWVTVSAYDPNVIEPPLPPRLPLFPELDRWAA